MPAGSSACHLKRHGPGGIDIAIVEPSDLRGRFIVGYNPSHPEIDLLRLEEVQARSAVLLVLIRAVADLAEAMDEDSPRQAVACFGAPDVTRPHGQAPRRGHRSWPNRASPRCGPPDSHSRPRRRWTVRPCCSQGRLSSWFVNQRLPSPNRGNRKSAPRHQLDPRDAHHHDFTAAGARHRDGRRLQDDGAGQAAAVCPRSKRRRRTSGPRPTRPQASSGSSRCSTLSPPRCWCW
jgi:hypothetical protein